jgi:hypothetical protein
LGMVIGQERHIRRYARIHQFLLQVKRVGIASRDAWVQSKTHRQQPQQPHSHSQHAVLHSCVKTELRWQQVHHLTSSLENFVLSHIHTNLFPQLQNQLMDLTATSNSEGLTKSSPQKLADVHSSFVCNVEATCFLDKSPTGEMVSSCLALIFDAILQMDRVAQMQRTNSDTRMATSAEEKAWRQYSKMCTFLFKGLFSSKNNIVQSNVADRGGGHDMHVGSSSNARLEWLRMHLDFNGYFSNKNKPVNNTASNLRPRSRVPQLYAVP